MYLSRKIATHISAAIIHHLSFIIPEVSITIILIAITVVVSLIGFGSHSTVDDLIFYPAVIQSKKQYYRFITYGFIHADLMHLIFNMYAFYLFGDFIERAFMALFGDQQGLVLYVLMYLLALIVCVIPDYIKYRNNYQYRSLGASGAVSAVVFAYILLNPLQGIGLIFIPFGIPGFLFGILYLVISFFLGRKKGSVINHNAHLWGAIFGIVFLAVVSKLLSDYPVIESFIGQIKNMRMGQLFQSFY